MNDTMHQPDQNLVTDFYRFPDNARLVDSRDGIPEEQRSRVLSKAEIIRLVTETGLDLVLVSSNGPQNVYKLIDYGKFRFDQQKKQRETERKQRENTRTLKECFFSPGITQHDYEIKMKQILGWINDHDVKIGMKLNFKARSHVGRHANWYMEARDPEFVLNRVMAQLGDKVTQVPLHVSEKQIYAILRPA